MRSGKTGKKGTDKDPPKPAANKEPEVVGSPTKTTDPKKTANTTTPKVDPTKAPKTPVGSPVQKQPATKAPATGTGTKAPATKVP